MPIPPYILNTGNISLVTDCLEVSNTPRYNRMKAINLTKTAGSAQCHSHNQKSFGCFSDSMRGIAIMPQSRKSPVLARYNRSPYPEFFKMTPYRQPKQQPDNPHSISHTLHPFLLYRSTRSAHVTASIAPAKTSSPDKTVPGSSSTVLGMF